MQKRVADLLIERLIEWDVDTIFGFPGDGVDGLFEALRTHQKELRFIQVRHEEAAACVACGYSKYTGHRDSRQLDGKSGSSERGQPRQWSQVLRSGRAGAFPARETGRCERIRDRNPEGFAEFLLPGLRGRSCQLKRAARKIFDGAGGKRCDGRLRTTDTDVKGAAGTCTSQSSSPTHDREVHPCRTNRGLLLWVERNLNG